MSCLTSCLTSCLFQKSARKCGRCACQSCSKTSCLYQEVDTTNSILYSTNSVSIQDVSLWDNELLSCLLLPGTSLDAVLLDLVTGIYVDIKLTLDNSSCIQLIIIFNGSVTISADYDYMLILPCYSCRRQQSCTDCLVLSLSNPLSGCNFFTVPAKTWTDISSLIDITSSPLGLITNYYITNCKYNPNCSIEVSYNLYSINELSSTNPEPTATYNVCLKINNSITPTQVLIYSQCPIVIPLGNLPLRGSLIKAIQPTSAAFISALGVRKQIIAKLIRQQGS